MKIIVTLNSVSYAKIFLVTTLKSEENYLSSMDTV